MGLKSGFCRSESVGVGLARIPCPLTPMLVMYRGFAVEPEGDGEGLAWTPCWA